MAADPDSSASPYDSARENIRDTVKWLVASLSALAAVVVGGVSFSGIGALPISNGRFFLAAGTLLLAFGCIAAALYITLRILRSDGLYASQLIDTHETKDTALQQVREEIKKYSSELLPLNFGTVEALLQRAKKLQEDSLDAIDRGDKATYQSKQDAFKAIDINVARILDFAVYSRLYRRLENGLRYILLAAAIALVSLLIFAATVDTPDEPAPTPTVAIIDHRCDYQCDPRAMAPNLAPVRFASGRAEIDEAGVASIAKASAFLNENPSIVMLLRAHTDTVAASRINRDLATRRGNAVRRMLLEAGGVAANRVFVAELPELSLPILTHEDTADERNRTVEFIVAEALSEDPRLRQSQ